MRRIPNPGIGSAIIGTVLACSPLTPRRPTPLPATHCAPQVLERLFFGLNRPGGGRVLETEWQRFLEEAVVTRFGAGLTVVEARGQWRGGNDQLEREPSRVVEIVHEDSAEAARRIDEIVGEYKRRFEQDAVLVIRQPVEACL